MMKLNFQMPMINKLQLTPSKHHILFSIPNSAELEKSLKLIIGSKLIKWEVLI